MLISTGLIVVMAVFIKVCAVHTPSSNPRKSKARKLTMTLPRRHRRRPNTHPTSQTTALTSGGGQSSGAGQGSEVSRGGGGEGVDKNVGASSSSASTAAGGGSSSSGAAAAVIVVEKVRVRLSFLDFMFCVSALLSWLPIYRTRPK